MSPVSSTASRRRLHRHKSTRDKPRSSPVGPSPPLPLGSPSSEPAAADGKEEKGIKESGSTGVMRSSPGGAACRRENNATFYLVSPSVPIRYVKIDVTAFI